MNPLRTEEMKKGEVWLIDLPDGQGHEQKGTRPALVMGTTNGLTIAIPITTNTNLAKFSHVLVIEPSSENGLTETSIAIIYQIRALDDARFKKKIGWIPKEQRAAINQLLKDLLKLDSD